MALLSAIFLFASLGALAGSLIAAICGNWLAAIAAALWCLCFSVHATDAASAVNTEDE